MKKWEKNRNSLRKKILTKKVSRSAYVEALLFRSMFWRVCGLEFELIKWGLEDNENFSHPQSVGVAGKLLIWQCRGISFYESRRVKGKNINLMYALWHCWCYVKMLRLLFGWTHSDLGGGGIDCVAIWNSTATKSVRMKTFKWLWEGKLEKFRRLMNENKNERAWKKPNQLGEHKNPNSHNVSLLFIIIRSSQFFLLSFMLRWDEKNHMFFDFLPLDNNKEHVTERSTEKMPAEENEFSVNEKLQIISASLTFTKKSTLITKSQ